MTTSDDAGGARGLNQSTAGGLAMLALAGVALWSTRGLDMGTLGQMGPGFLPRALAGAVGLCGLALVGFGTVRAGERISGFSLRGALLVPLAIVLFALTIRPVDIGLATTPGLGLAVAGPLTVLVGGFATPEARLRELIPVALLLNAFCIVLFGDLLNLPIPIFPEAARPWFAGWTQHGILRAIAGGMAVLGAVFALYAWNADRRADA